MNEGKVKEFKSVRINIQDKHGSGCVFSAALAVFLSKGYSLQNSLERSNQFMARSLNNTPKLGIDYGPVL